MRRMHYIQRTCQRASAHLHHIDHTVITLKYLYACGTYMILYIDIMILMMCVCSACVCYVAKTAVWHLFLVSGGEVPLFSFFFFLFLATCDRCGCSCDFALSAYQSMAAATQPKQNRLFVKVVMISLKITSLPCWVVECSTGLMHNVSLYINEYIVFVYIETVWKIEA